MKVELKYQLVKALLKEMFQIPIKLRVGVLISPQIRQLINNKHTTGKISEPKRILSL